MSQGRTVGGRCCRSRGEKRGRLKVELFISSSSSSSSKDEDSRQCSAEVEAKKTEKLPTQCQYRIQAVIAPVNAMKLRLITGAKRNKANVGTPDCTRSTELCLHVELAPPPPLLLLLNPGVQAKHTGQNTHTHTQTHCTGVCPAPISLPLFKL